MKLTKTDSRRRSLIIRELSRLSRNSWAHAKPEDYLPLEKELREIEGRR